MKRMCTRVARVAVRFRETRRPEANVREPVMETFWSTASARCATLAHDARRPFMGVQVRLLDRRVVPVEFVCSYRRPSVSRLICD